MCSTQHSVINKTFYCTYCGSVPISPTSFKVPGLLSFFLLHLGMEVLEWFLQTIIPFSRYSGGRHPLSPKTWSAPATGSFPPLHPVNIGAYSWAGLVPSRWFLSDGGVALPVWGAATCTREVYLTSCCPHLSSRAGGATYTSASCFPRPLCDDLTSLELCGTSRMGD